MNQLFNPGFLVATPGAIDALQRTQQTAYEFIKRHISGDWGTVSQSDKQLNDEAVKDGSRIMSVYQMSDKTPIWIITEAEDDDGNRSATTLLLPDEY